MSSTPKANKAAKAQAMIERLRQQQQAVERKLATKLAKLGKSQRTSVRDCVCVCVCVCVARIVCQRALPLPPLSWGSHAHHTLLRSLRHNWSLHPSYLTVHHDDRACV